MVSFSRATIQRHLLLSQTATSRDEQGRAFEDLICYVFERIPGVKVDARNSVNPFRSEEIDIGCWNEQLPSGLNFLPNILLLECKHWWEPVGSMQVSWFYDKLERRGLDLGFLIATNGITGDTSHRNAAYDTVAGKLREGKRIIVITLADIQQLRTTGNLVELCKTKLVKLAAEVNPF